MALTYEEISEILKLRGDGYSIRKIADKTGHSEATIVKAIAEAREQVIKLLAEGLGKDEIAGRKRRLQACL